MNPDTYAVHGVRLTSDEMIARADALLDCGWLRPLPRWAKARLRAKAIAYRNRTQPGWREQCEPSLLVA